MKFPIKTPLVNGVIALLAGSLLFGCAAKRKPSVPPKPVAERPAEETIQATDTQAVAVKAWVQAMNRSRGTLTLKFADGTIAKVDCGPELMRFSQVEVGDDITAEFKEAADLVVVGPGGEPAVEEATVGKRGRQGRKPAGAAGRAFEVTATVTAIDYDSRRVSFKKPEGGTVTITASPEVKRLNGIKPGDRVVARYLEVTAIKVAAPQKIPTRQ